MAKTAACLWFDGKAEQAADFYVSIFKNSEVIDRAFYGDAGPGELGTLMSIRFRLDEQEFVGLNGGPQFKFNEAISFVVNCENQAEVDRFWDRLSVGGETGDCGWLKDRFGLSWQIVPVILPHMLHDTDVVRRDRVVRAMLPMKKLDVAALERAYAGD